MELWAIVLVVGFALIAIAWLSNARANYLDDVSADLADQCEIKRKHQTSERAMETYALAQKNTARAARLWHVLAVIIALIGIVCFVVGVVLYIGSVT